MHSVTEILSQLDDAALLVAVSNNVHDNRLALVQLLRYLGEVNARKLYAREGYASLFAFCLGLNFSDSEAYKRCLVGRVGRQYPALVDAIGAGTLHLTGAAMIASKMRADNAAALIAMARHKSKRALEGLLANMFPAACGPRRAVVRAVPVLPAVRARAGAKQDDATAPSRARVGEEAPKSEHQRGRYTLQTQLPLQSASPAPTGTTVGETPSPLPAGDTTSRATSRVANSVGQVEPSVAPQAYRLHVNLDAADYALLSEAQDLLSHRLPGADLGKVIGLALAALVEQLQGRKNARLKRRGSSPSQVKATSPFSGQGPLAKSVHAKPDVLPAGEAEGHEAAKRRPGNSAAAKMEMHGQTGGRVAATSHRREAANAKGETGGTANAPNAVPPHPGMTAAAQMEKLGGAGVLEVTTRHPGKAAAMSRSRTLSRAVKRKVYERDAGACTYIAENGRRCGARAFLEYHHVHAFGLGGCNAADNVTLHCRTHNALAAVKDFGAAHQARAIAGRLDVVHRDVAVMTS